MQHVNSYIICTTARSGSNLVCDYLRNTQLLGNPAEFFNPDVVGVGYEGKRFLASNELSVGAYIEWLRTTFVSANGIFGLKVLHEDFDHLRVFPDFASLFESSRIIFLRRRSKLRQAISYYFAEITGQWVYHDNPRVSVEDVKFDFDKIHGHFDRLVRQELDWLRVLEVMDVAYTELIFEEFVKNPSNALHSLARDFGIHEEFPVCATLREQVNEFTKHFIDEYRIAASMRLFKEEKQVRYKGKAFIA